MAKHRNKNRQLGYTGNPRSTPGIGLAFVLVMLGLVFLVFGLEYLGVKW